MCKHSFKTQNCQAGLSDRGQWQAGSRAAQHGWLRPLLAYRTPASLASFTPVAGYNTVYYLRVRLPCTKLPWRPTKIRDCYVAVHVAASATLLVLFIPSPKAGELLSSCWLNANTSMAYESKARATHPCAKRNASPMAIPATSTSTAIVASLGGRTANPIAPTR